ncbi:MAG: DUF1127 domain-containing protein [Hyphomicrobiaceae bacterium]
MSTAPDTSVSPAGPATAPGIARRLGLRLGLWLRRSRTRAQLSQLEARLVRDAGLTSAQRRREVAKWFWQP